MYSPAYRPDNLLSEWVGCFLEICCGCGRSSHPPVKLLPPGDLGNITFKSYLSRLRCQQCRWLSGPVYLRTGHHRTFCDGGAPDRLLEVVTDPNWRGGGFEQQTGPALW